MIKVLDFAVGPSCCILSRSTFNCFVTSTSLTKSVYKSLWRWGFELAITLLIDLYVKLCCCLSVSS